MAFPTDLTNFVDHITVITATHLNALEVKVGVDASAVVTSLDYLLKNPASIDPGHKHSKLWASDGSPEAVTVDAAGNVGIGTTSPKGPLHLVGNQIIVQNAAASLAFWVDGTPTKACGIKTSSAGHLCFQVFNGTAWVECGRISNDTSNLMWGVTALGTNAAKVIGLGSGTAPTTAPADLAQMWVQDINGAAGYAGLHKRTETTNVTEIIPGVVIKGTTGQTANPYEGLIEINTFDNTVKIYADGAWRTLASGW